MKGNLIMKKSLAFTLAEVLITLAIIGVVAAMTIPSVIVNTNQQEFKTGLRKAVSVLNSSITMNMAMEGETPYDNEDLFGYLQQHMSVMKSTTGVTFNEGTDKVSVGGTEKEAPTGNLAFYTTDGMRFEIPKTTASGTLHENGETLTFNTVKDRRIGTCGSNGYGANNNDTDTPPCMIMVDVNGDRKPNPANASDTKNVYTVPGAGEKLLKDVFSIIITDEKAVPFGVTAQKAMYQAQK